MKKRTFTLEFKKEAVALVSDQGYTISRTIAGEQRQNAERMWSWQPPAE